MLFGVVNAQIAFQRMMNTVLADCIASDFCRVYIGGTAVYSNTYREHAAHLNAMLSAVETSRPVSKQPECFARYHQTVHLDYLVGVGGIRVDPSTTRAIDEYLEPHTVSEVHSFLGLAGYCSRIRRARRTALRPYSCRLAIVLGVPTGSDSQ